MNNSDVLQLPFPDFISLRELTAPQREAAMTDYGEFYDLEDYLFGTVTARFQSKHQLDAFDFFCIVIWKANRARDTLNKRSS